MTRSTIPRTAGTGTFLDVLASLVGRGRRPKDDVAALDDGKDVAMVAYVDPDGAAARRIVVLSLDATRAGGVRAVFGDPPYDVLGIEPPRTWRIDDAAFRVLGGRGPGGPWRVAVPSRDVSTVHHVLRRLSTPPPTRPPVAAPSRPCGY